MRVYWRQAKIKTILDEAQASGSTRVWFATKSDAERFRYAAYGLAKRKNFVGKFIFELDTKTKPNTPELLERAAFCSIIIRLAKEPTIMLGPAQQ